MKKNNSDNTQVEQTVDEATPPSPHHHITLEPNEVIIGTITSVNELGEPLVNFPGNAAGHPIVATSILTLPQQQINRQVILSFMGGKVDKPVITGFIRSLLHDMLERFDASQTDNHLDIKAGINVDDVRIDDNKLLFEAKDEIVIRSGESSITLKKDGTILLRGTKISTRSTGENRIMGASIHLN